MLHQLIEICVGTKLINHSNVPERFQCGPQSLTTAIPLEIVLPACSRGMASFLYCDRWQPVEGGPWFLPVCWDMFQPSMTQDKSRYVCECMVNLNTIHSKLSISVSGAVQGQNLNLNARNLLIPHMAWSGNLMGHYMLHHKTFGFKPSVYSPTLITAGMAGHQYSITLWNQAVLTTIPALGYIFL